MTYYNPYTNKYYYGGAMTITLNDGSLWSGIPTSTQLHDWGYEIYIPPMPSGEISAEEALDIITNGE